MPLTNLHTLASSPYLTIRNGEETGGEETGTFYIS